MTTAEIIMFVFAQIGAVAVGLGTATLIAIFFGWFN